MAEEKTWEARVLFKAPATDNEQFHRQRIRQCIETHPTLGFMTEAVGIFDVDEGLTRSVIYRIQRGFNGLPGPVLCEVEHDLPPKLGDIVELSSHDYVGKRRYVVESATKEVYATSSAGSDIVTWVIGVTRLHDTGRTIIDDEDAHVLREFIKEPTTQAILLRMLGDLPRRDINTDELLRELLTRLA